MNQKIRPGVLLAQLIVTSMLLSLVFYNSLITVKAADTVGVSLSISPSSQTGLNGVTLTYTVTINNYENADTYSLVAADNAGWSPSVSPTSRFMAGGSTDNTTTLSVTVPENALGETVDNITVTATSQSDNTVNGSASCTAEATIGRSVSVSISPTDNYRANGVTLNYTLTINNTGNVSDNYSLIVTDDAGWSPSISSTSLMIAALSSDNTTVLSVTVPENAISGTVDNMTVTATSQTDNTVSASNSCTAQATIIIDLSVSISPEDNIGLNGSMLNYIVTVSNTGNVSDNYSLSVSDDAYPSWDPSILPTSLLDVPSDGNETATLSVMVPENAPSGAIDDMTIIATSQTDITISASGSCTAQVTARGVSVSISPGDNFGLNGVTLNYTMTVNNIGNIDDNYLLTVRDDASPSWAPSLSPILLTVAAGNGGDSTLSVTIPSDAVGGMVDNITVVATSQTDTTVNGSGSCTAQVTIARSVSLSIYPSSQSGTKGATLTFTVTVNNTGIADDNYLLTVTDDASPSWNSTVSPSSLSVSAGRSGNATVSLTIPEDTISGTVDNITVIAISQTDTSVSASAGCTATARSKQGISLWVYVGAVVIILLIIGAVLRIERARRKLHGAGSQNAPQNARKLTK